MNSTAACMLSITPVQLVINNPLSTNLPASPVVAYTQSVHVCMLFDLHQ
jgi:hypothetical protein